MVIIFVVETGSFRALPDGLGQRNSGCNLIFVTVSSILAERRQGSASSSQILREKRTTKGHRRGTQVESRFLFSLHKYYKNKY